MSHEPTKPRVLITQRAFPETLAMFTGRADLRVNETPDPWPEDQLLRAARGAHALMVFMPDSLDARFLRQCPKLQVVAAALKGCDNFDVEECSRLGIWFTIVPDLLSEPTAELALALMLGLARNVRMGDELIRSGQFHGWRPVFYGRGLSGSTVGIIGFGAVGRALARILRGFDCRILYHDERPRKEELRVQRASFEELLQVSDFVLPLLPLTAVTFHLLGRDVLGCMKPGSFLINVSRGAVVDEEAVTEALENGRLAGYAADVFEMEDWARPDRPGDISPRLLSQVTRTLFTPHLGSAVLAARRAIERAAALNILEALDGRRPGGAINCPAPPRNGAN